MSSELSTVYTTGKTLYAICFSPTGTVWNTSTLSFESAVSANWTNYVVLLTESNGSGVYVGNFPTGITSAGVYAYDVRYKSTGSYLVADLSVADGTVNWTGSTEALGGVYLLSLAEYNLMNNTSTTDQTKYNAQVSALIPSINDEIDNYLGWHVIQSSYSEVLNGTGNTFIRLENKPIVQVTAITMGVDTDTTTVVDVSRVIIDSQNTGMIRFKPNSNYGAFDEGRQNILVQYIAGYNSNNVPQAIKRAAVSLIKRSVLLGNPTFLTTSKKFGEASITYGTNWMDVTNALYSDVRKILDFYKRIRYIF